MLEEFHAIFEEPKQLPPHRSHDHQILLKDGAVTVNVKPYRHSVLQKDVMEKMTMELLDSGLIRPNNSYFSSHVVLVKKKKKDGSWRMCIDYRELNKNTVKDRYLIPMIVELLDELNGVVIFSKIDLRSGYHQIRMDPADVYKMTFKTHDGHYEF